MEQIENAIDMRGYSSTGIDPGHYYVGEDIIIIDEPHGIQIDTTPWVIEVPDDYVYIDSVPSYWTTQTIEFIEINPEPIGRLEGVWVFDMTNLHLEVSVVQLALLLGIAFVAGTMAARSSHKKMRKVLDDWLYGRARFRNK